MADNIDKEDEVESPPQNLPLPTNAVQQTLGGYVQFQRQEKEDSAFLELTYDFTRIPNSFHLSSNHHLLEYLYYRYKPMLVKAQHFVRLRQLGKALDYYRTINDQNIPPELKAMINHNIKDVTDYLKNYMTY